MNKNSMNLGQYNNRHVIKHVTLKLFLLVWLLLSRTTFFFPLVAQYTIFSRVVHDFFLLGNRKWICLPRTGKQKPLYDRLVEK